MSGFAPVSRFIFHPLRVSKYSQLPLHIEGDKQKNKNVFRTYAFVHEGKTSRIQFHFIQIDMTGTGRQRTNEIFTLDACGKTEARRSKIKGIFNHG